MASMVLLVPVYAFVGTIASAQQGVDTRGLENLLQKVQRLISMIVPILIALALLAFLWGVLGYLFKKNEGKNDAKAFMIWGIIALFVMTSVWGLVSIIKSSLVPNGSNSLDGNIPIIPTFSTGNNPQ